MGVIEALIESTPLFSDATTHLHKKSCPSVRRSVCPVIFSNDKDGRFEGKKSSNDITINDTMSDDKVVASDVSPRYLFPFIFLVLFVLHKHLSSHHKGENTSLNK